jgi:hypothetical protein
MGLVPHLYRHKVRSKSLTLKGFECIRGCIEKDTKAALSLLFA